MNKYTVLLYFKKSIFAKNKAMECRQGCGACCIAISISSSIPGMPDGKPAGVRCIHLLEDYRCALWEKPERPKVCGDFQAEELFCGKDRDEALRIISSLC